MARTSDPAWAFIPRDRRLGVSASPALREMLDEGLKFGVRETDHSEEPPVGGVRDCARPCGMRGTS